MDILDSGPNSCLVNMSRDSDLLASLESRREPLLHLYDWSAPSLTYGYFTKHELLLDTAACEREGVSMARRPTGGGVIFHLTDFAFSFFLPATHSDFSSNTLENYALVNHVVIEAIGECIPKRAELLAQEPTPLDAHSASFCMAKPTVYDVILDGKKVGGASQRRTRFGLLHQGSISLQLPPFDLLERLLLPNTRVLEAMRHFSYPLLGDEELASARARFKEALKRAFLKKFT